MFFTYLYLYFLNYTAHYNQDIDIDNRDSSSFEWILYRNPEINWSLLKTNSCGDKFLKLILSCFLEQHVLEATRSNNILDLIFTSKLPIQYDILILPPFDNFNHNVLIGKFDCKSDPVSEKTHLCYNQADYDGMRIFVKVQLSNIDFSVMSASEMWILFNGIIQEDILYLRDSLPITVRNPYG